MSAGLSRAFLVAAARLSAVRQSTRDQQAVMDAFSVAQRQSLERYVGEESGPRCIADGPLDRPPDAALVNRDLDPLDEYFLNNAVAVPTVARCRV